MVLVRPVGMILPSATATMSTVPMLAQASAALNTMAIVQATARPTGDGGVSTISSAAGRKASSSRRRSCLRSARRCGKDRMFLADFMQAGLQAVEGGGGAAGRDRVLGGG